MRVTVMGAGALGGYFGARLAAAGETVTFVARGAHLAAMQAGGLRVESPLGDLHQPQVRAVASPEEAGPADLVLLMVKTYDVEDAADRLAPTLAPGAAVMTVQNGVTAPARVAARIGAERGLAGI